MKTFEKVYYEGRNGFDQKHEVAYRIYGRQILFTGLHKEGGSTINLAEEVIIAIAQAEQINAREYLFYDLQTHLSYPGHKPGDYTFNELVPIWEDNDRPHRPVSMSWREGHCDPQVLGDCADFIWGNHYPRGKMRNLPVYRGAIDPLPANPPRPSLHAG